MDHHRDDNSLSMDLNALPFELLAMIFEQLNVLDRLRLNCVSKEIKGKNQLIPISVFTVRSILKEWYGNDVTYRQIVWTHLNRLFLRVRFKICRVDLKFGFVIAPNNRSRNLCACF